MAALVADARFGPLHALLLVAASGATMRLVPIAARLARRWGAVALPGGRSVHARPTPLCGGVAIGVVVIVPLAFSGDARAISLGLGCLLLVAAGVRDDLVGVSPRWKLLVQACAALIIYAGGFRLQALQMPPLGRLDLGPYGLFAFMLWVVLVTNAVNLIDGVDGLAAGVGFIGALACVMCGQGMIASLLLAGSLIGFLRFNLPRASIFLGDGGSQLIGFLLAASLAGAPNGLHLPVAFGVLVLPLGDVLLCVLRRALRGKPIFVSDRSHLHHRLQRTIRDDGRVVMILLALAVTLAALLVAHPDLYGLIAGSVLWAAFVAWVMRDVVARRWDIFRQRRAFKRLHILREYTFATLRLAETRAEVEHALRRMAEDLDCSYLRVRGVEIVNTAREAVSLATTTLDCGACRATWTGPRLDGAGTLSDERQTLVCDLLRQAVTTLDRLEGAPTSATAAGRDRALPRVDFVASSRKDLLHLAHVYCAALEGGVIRPVIVHTGLRRALDLESLPNGLSRVLDPHICLGLDAEDDTMQTARARECYGLFLEEDRPALTVLVGSTRAAIACAVASERRGLPVAYLRGGGVEPDQVFVVSINRSLGDSLTGPRMTEAETDHGLRHVFDRTRAEGGSAVAAHAIETLVAEEPFGANRT